MPLIVARDLTKRYPGVLALDGLTIDLEPGIIGFVGANGAGKSTFIRILLGLLAPTSGSASVLGLDTQTEALQVRALVGYMPEHDCLPPDMSGTDFVTHMGQVSGLPFTTARERAAEMLRHVGLHEERYRLIGTYSTGMKQRVKLAQALAHDPKLLLLDEPTNGLDPEGREEMLGLVERTGREFGIAVLLTSHLLGEIERVCDHLMAIDAGRLQYSGAVSTFTEQTERLRIGLDEDVPEFAARLRAAGIEVEGHGLELRVPLGDASVYDLVRDTAADLGAPIARLELTRHRLEELFSTHRQDPGMADARAAGTIYDLGYQRYSGARLGRAYAIRSLIGFSWRAAFGIGRGAKSRRVPLIVTAVVFLPAVMQVGIASMSAGMFPINYGGQLELTALMLVLFAAAQAPELIVTDRQNGVLSLYLSRPLRSTDYALAKLAALIGAMLILTLGPQLFLFVGKVFIDPSPWGAFKREWKLLFPIVGGTFAVSCFMASLGLALSCRAARRAYATASVIAFFLLTAAAATLLRDLTDGSVHRYATLGNPVWVMTGFANWLFDIQAQRHTVVGRADLPGQAYLFTILSVCAVSIALLLSKYRRADG